jgi:putative oxidoreductase
MNVGFALGRILLALVFFVSGAQKLMGVTDAALIGGTAGMMERIVLPSWSPAAIADTAGQIASAVGVTVPRLLEIVIGVIEVVGALLIAFNVLMRTSAFILLLYTLLATILFHDFWNQIAGDARNNGMNHALKNLAIMGGLLILFSLPRRIWVYEREPVYYPEERGAVIREREIVREAAPPQP